MGGAGKASHDEDAAVVQENGPQGIGSDYNTAGEAETGNTKGTPAQRGGERNGNQEAEAAPGNGENAGLEDSEGSPSGDGADQDQGGSGDGEGGETRNGRGGCDTKSGQEGRAHGREEDSSLRQSSVSPENENTEGGGLPHTDTGGDGTSDSQGDSGGAPQGNGSPRGEDAQKPSERKSKDVGNGIPKEFGPSTVGKTQEKVGFDSDFHQ